MPCCALESTSLIILPWAAVNSSSSLTWSRMGSTCRLTYALVANGWVMSAPRLGSSPSQKSCWEDCFSPAFGCELEADGADCALEVELGCCANAASATTVDKSSVKNIRLFISSSFQVHPSSSRWPVLAGQNPEHQSFGTRSLSDLLPNCRKLTPARHCSAGNPRWIPLSACLLPLTPA